MIVYGRNPVRELLSGARGARRVWAAPELMKLDWLAGVPCQRADDPELQALCGSPDHQGVCAEAEPYPYAAADELLERDDALVVCLDEVQDPHNLGAVCRVVEAAGAEGIVIPERRSAVVTPAVCRASAGAVEHVRLARVRNLAEYLAEAKRIGAWVYGASAGAPVGYERPDYSGRVALVLGSEGRGLRPRVARSCDQLIALPDRGRVGSLNVSTAAAALVYGILHFREAGA